MTHLLGLPCLQFDYDEMWYVTADQQALHFQQLFEILKRAGFDFVNQLTHIQFGMVKGMSSRAGTAVFLADILDEGKVRPNRLSLSPGFPSPSRFSCLLCEPKLAGLALVGKGLMG